MAVLHINHTEKQICDECGQQYVPWSVSKEEWKKYVPFSKQLDHLCLTCFLKLKGARMALMLRRERHYIEEIKIDFKDYRGFEDKEKKVKK